MQLKQELLEELKQNQILTDGLILQILYSKRLLVDHVEALEQCLPLTVDHTDCRAIDRKKNEIFTARNACVLLGSTILEHFITPKSLKITLIPSLLIAGGFSAIYLVKNAFIFRNKIVERELNNLIRTIENFGNCIRRNMTYFNEIIVMKQQELIESRKIERAWDCITAAKEVIEILFDTMRKLEAQYPLPTKYLQYYSSMEELRECEYFKNNVTDYTPKHIKDFYNIFSYVQSQFFLCLALIISTKPPINKLNIELTKINCLIRQLVQEEENHFKNLNIELKKHLELEALNLTKVMQNRKGPVAVLQDSSLKLSARMVAVASECQTLDKSLQQLNEIEALQNDNSNYLVQVANNMRSIGNTLSTCFDDFQKLMLVYNKFLNSKINIKDDVDNMEDNIELPKNEFPESFLRVEISQNENNCNEKDDFYAYMFDEQQQSTVEEEQNTESKLPYEVEISNYEKRITKGKFQPVLKQLKDRIDPIRVKMLERERQILTAKGINVDGLFEKESESIKDDHKMQSSDESSEEFLNDSDDSAELEYRKRTKLFKNRDNFAEMRNLLAQKTPIKIFDTEEPKKIKALGLEDILESEC